MGTPGTKRDAMILSRPYEVISHHLKMAAEDSPSFFGAVKSTMF
jgi:hypothetical protein